MNPFINIAENTHYSKPWWIRSNYQDCWAAEKRSLNLFVFSNVIDIIFKLSQRYNVTLIQIFRCGQCEGVENRRDAWSAGCWWADIWWFTRQSKDSVRWARVKGTKFKSFWRRRGEWGWIQTKDWTRTLSLTWYIKPSRPIAMNTCIHGFTSFRLSFLSCDPRAFSLLEYQASPSHILFDTTVVKVNLEMTEKVVPNTFYSCWSYVVKYLHLCVWATTFVPSF